MEQYFKNNKVGSFNRENERGIDVRNKCIHCDVSLCSMGILGCIIGPFFFENAVGRAITVNGARYRDAIVQFFLPKLQDIGVTQPEKQFDHCIRVRFLAV